MYEWKEDADQERAVMRMGKELFPNLYGVIEEMAKGDAKKEAEILLAFMDEYEKPKMPFKNVTNEAIKKMYDQMAEQYGFVLWSNEYAASDESCAEMVSRDPEIYIGIPEEEVRDECIQLNMDERSFLRNELEEIEVNGVIVTGTVGRWDGEFPAFSEFDSLGEIFSGLDGDNCTLFIKDGQLRGVNHHHDGTNWYVFHTCKEGIDPADIEFPANEDHLESLVPVLAEHFGWKPDSQALRA